MPASPAILPPSNRPGPPGRARALHRWTTSVALVALALLGALEPSLGVANAGTRLALTERESEEREYQIKAVFLLNFIRYTTWPKDSFAEPDSPILLTVVGKDPFGEILEKTFRGEEAHGRRIEVARARELPEMLAGHVVLCGELAETARAELLRKCAKRPLLVIGETPDFAAQGACINLYLQEQKTRFEINTDVLTENTLEISPALLKLAKIVHREH